MRDTVRHRLRAGVLLLAVPAGIAGAAEPSHPCARVDDPAQRLACYDAAFPRPSPAATFGLPAPRPAPAAPARAAARADEIHDAVAALGVTPAGKHVVTLGNGQVWIQTDTSSMPALKPGAEVRIEKAAFGSYLLFTGDRASMRVRRAQ